MSNYTVAHNSPRAVTLGGREYLVSKLRPHDFGDLQAWFATKVPDPRKVAREHMEGLPTETQQFIWLEALKQAKSWPPKFGSEEATALLMSPEGLGQLLYLALRRQVAGMTVEAANDIYAGTSEQELADLLEAIMPGDDDDPKGGAADARSRGSRGRKS